MTEKQILSAISLIMVISGLLLIRGNESWRDAIGIYLFISGLNISIFAKK
jgi:uncharacterized protein YjeT (DUF2065 family)